MPDLRGAQGAGRQRHVLSTVEAAHRESATDESVCAGAGAGTIALILFIKRYKPLIPGALLALILGTLIPGIFQLNAKYNVAVVVFLAPLLRNLPSAVLGGIVLSSILGLQ